MKKFIKIVSFVLILVSCSNHKSGARSASDTIEESKERGTFIKELDYKIVPDTIKLAKNTSFYLERGFRNGDYSSSSLKENTAPLLPSDNYTYQINKNPESGEYFEGHFLMGDGDNWRFHKMNDTIIRDIVTKVPQYDSIYKVGELLLFKKYK